MQQLNKVVLIGLVGTIRRIGYGENTLSQLSIATNVAYTSANGDAVIETTWHQVETYADTTNLAKGDAVMVEGRLAQVRYTDTKGEQHNSQFIRAVVVEKLDEPATLQMV